ncbi:unnamed protein product [marine sediment metagenome]|uniref:Uncharacterized protein n=1 Tax=marine sediment metagenome TaxID=412755 RepID=X1EJP2_9ZZZZ
MKWHPCRHDNIDTINESKCHCVDCGEEFTTGKVIIKMVCKFCQTELSETDDDRLYCPNEMCLYDYTIAKRDD